MATSSKGASLRQAAAQQARRSRADKIARKRKTHALVDSAPSYEEELNYNNCANSAQCFNSEVTCQYTTPHVKTRKQLRSTLACIQSKVISKRI
jgi:hypothetical protein